MPTPPRLYLFHGPDGFSAREAARALRTELSVSDGDVVRLDDKASLNEIAAATHTATFFAEPRLVIIDGLSKRFSERGRGGRRNPRGRGREKKGASEIDQLVETLSTTPDTTTVVLLEEKAPPAFLEAFKGVAKATLFPVKHPPELRRWAEARVKSQGGSISAAAIELMSQMVDGHHLGELAQEIDKLIAYTGGRRIEVEDIEEIGASAIQHQTWDLTDAVVAGQAGKALRVLQRMDEKEHPAQLLLSMIVRQYRHVFLAQTLLKEGYAAPQIGERLGIAHSFPLGKVIDQASRYPADRLEPAYRRLLEADAAVKTGVMDIDTALELLIVDLAEIANAGRRRTAEASRPAARR